MQCNFRQCRADRHFAYIMHMKIFGHSRLRDNGGRGGD
jgi:hypothetical protein